MKTNIDNGFFYFPAPFVYHYNVPEHAQIKQELQPKLESFYRKHHEEQLYKWDTRKVHQSGVCTNFNDALLQRDWYTQKHLQAIVWNSLDELLSKLKYKNKKCKLVEFWWNVYQKGDSAPVHNHGTFGISGVYLLHLNEPNKTIFFSKSKALLKNYTDIIDYSTNEVPEGTVMLFPSSLSHHVEPAETTRMSISFNVTIS
jgi:uncharacterized protein (TIGR02466 family)